MQGGGDHNKRTDSLHEMTLPAFSNTRSSRPTRSVNPFRRAFPIFMPGDPFTLKEMHSSGV